MAGREQIGEAAERPVLSAWKLPRGERPEGCTCGYPTFENNPRVRFHTYDCQIRTGFNLGHALAFLDDEIGRARAKFADFNSPHEGYAVIAEELEELWEHVKANTGRTVAAREEAIQIAAMAVRFALDLTGDALTSGDSGASPPAPDVPASAPKGETNA